MSLCWTHPKYQHCLFLQCFHLPSAKRKPPALFLLARQQVESPRLEPLMMFLTAPPLEMRIQLLNLELLLMFQTAPPPPPLPLKCKKPISQHLISAIHINISISISIIQLKMFKMFIGHICHYFSVKHKIPKLKYCYFWIALNRKLYFPNHNSGTTIIYFWHSFLILQ